MSLRYALLAALHESPATGYDLTQRFRERLGHVWNASHQQIYRELARLHEVGHVAMEAQPRTDRPDRKLYRITHSGAQALQAWLGSAQPRPATRDPLLLKLFAGDLLETAALQSEMAQQREQWQTQLADFLRIEQTFFSHPAELSHHFRLQYLALRRGILNLQAWLQWADELEDALREQSRE